MNMPPVHAHSSPAGTALLAAAIAALLLIVFLPEWLDRRAYRRQRDGIEAVKRAGRRAWEQYHGTGHDD